jgi:hypothetical protein
MNVPSRINRLGTMLVIWIAVLWITGCAATGTDVASAPQFGQSVRAALLAQELPVSSPPKPTHATYMELQQSLESHQKAKPVTNNTNRSSLNNTTRPFGQ